MGKSGLRISVLAGFVFLSDAAPARWILLGGPRQPNIHPIAPHAVEFRTRFEIPSDRDRALLDFRALRAATISLDGEVVHREALAGAEWRRRRSVDLGRVPAGSHTLRVRVESDSTPAMLWAVSEDLSLATGPGWEARGLRGGWRPAALASEGPHSFAFAREFPHARVAFQRSLVYLLPVLLLVATGSLWLQSAGGRLHR